jgi:hypothetical protein
MGCNGVMTDPYIIKEGDISDFTKTDRFDLKLIRYEGFFENSIADQYNGIFVNSIDFRHLFPTGKPDPGFANYIKDFLQKLPEKQEMYNNINLFCTYKNGNNEIITYFHIKDNKIMGYAHPISKSKDIATDDFILDSELEFAKKNNKTILWYGDEVSLKIDKKIKEQHLVFFRRISSISKELPETIEPLDKVFVPEHSVVCNSVPSTKRQLMEGGFPTSNLKMWQEYKAQVEQLTHEFQERISSLADLRHQMTEGNSDVLFIIAHSDGTDLFIGDQKVSLEQIKEWGTRKTPTSRNRLAILCVCKSSDQHLKTGSLFWKKRIDPLANILLENGYFDQVIAPDHNILRPETIGFIQTLLKNKSISEIQAIFNGWGPYVSAFLINVNLN